MPNENNLPEYVELKFAEISLSDHDEDEKNDLRRFNMLALTGNRVEQSMFMEPLIVDLAGIIIKEGPIPVLLNHDPKIILGHSESVSTRGKKLSVKGVLSGAAAATADVIKMADNGFPWRASARLQPQDIQFLDEKENAKVNGKIEKGPLAIFRVAELEEVSFVSMGADTGAKVTVLSLRPHNQNPEENQTMADSEATKEEIEAARKAGADDMSKRIVLLKAEFPDRSEFVLDQAAKGHTVQEAKADFSEVLLGEKKTSDEILAARDAEILELKEAQNSAAGSSGEPAESPGTDATQFTGAADSDPKSFVMLSRARAKQEGCKLHEAMSYISLTNPQAWQEHNGLLGLIKNVPLK